MISFDLRGQTWGQKSISVNPGVIIGPDGKQLLLNKGEIRNPHDGEAFVGKYGEILDVGNGYLLCTATFQNRYHPKRPPSFDCFGRALSADISFTFVPLTVHLSVMGRSRARILIANSGIITLKMAYVQGYYVSLSWINRTVRSRDLFPRGSWPFGSNRLSPITQGQSQMWHVIKTSASRSESCHQMKYVMMNFFHWFHEIIPNDGNQMFV